MTKPAGEIIKERRKRKGWSQTVLGDMVGMSAATVHRVEHGEKVPTDQEALMIAGMLGIEHEEMLLACQKTRENQSGQIPKTSYKLQWDTAHPASYAGNVWIQIYPSPENRTLPHEFTIRWGVWERKGSITLEGDNTYQYLWHYKHNDGLGLPLYLTLNHPCYVVFGKGEPPDPVNVMEIHFGWRRVEPPPPHQLWQYCEHYVRWLIKSAIKKMRPRNR